VRPTQRWLILGGLLCATLVAGYLVDDEPVPQKDKHKVRSAVKSAASLSAMDSRTGAGGKEKAVELAIAPLNFPEPAPVEATDEGKKVIDPFRNKTWYVAPPPPPLPPPSPPPLPFQYLGKLTEEGVTRVFLNYQGKYLVAKEGDDFDGIYSVEEITGGRMTFLYQPMKIKQVLAIGADR